MPEWLNGAVSKTVEPFGVPWVRIPVSPHPSRQAPSFPDGACQYIVLRMSIPGKEKVFDRCMTIRESIGKQPSVRSNVFKMMVVIAVRHSGPKRELILGLPHAMCE